MAKSSLFLVFGALINGIESAPTDSTNDKEIQKFARIIDGTPINATDHPFYVNLDENYCGGVILTERWVLTAAHCVYDIENQDWKRGKNLYVGGESIETSELYHYDNAKIHPSYFVNPRIGDLALLHVSQPLKFSDKVKPIELPTKGYEEGPVYLIGRGMDEEDLKKFYSERIEIDDSSSDETDSSDSDSDDEPPIYLKEEIDSSDSDYNDVPIPTIDLKIQRQPDFIYDEDIFHLLFNYFKDYISDFKKKFESKKSRKYKQKLNPDAYKSKVTKAVELYALPHWNDECTNGGRGFCTIRKGMKPSACPGDSGSPLVRGNTLIGITSSILNTLGVSNYYACAFSYLTECTNVAFYTYWIKGIIEH